MQIKYSNHFNAIAYNMECNLANALTLNNKYAELGTIYLISKLSGQNLKDVKDAQKEHVKRCREAIYRSRRTRIPAKLKNIAEAVQQLRMEKYFYNSI